MRRSRYNEPLGQVAHCVESELRQQLVEEQAHDDVEKALASPGYDPHDYMRPSDEALLSPTYVHYWAGGSSED